MTATLICDDAVSALARLPACSIDAVVTDPPYGLSAEPDVAEVLRHWLAGDDYRHRGGGFMGRSWDSFVPGPVYWRQCFRVLKPGGYLLAFSSTRTEDLLGIALRLAGFERRDTIAYLYGSGFPKSLDVSKAIDKQDARVQRYERAIEFTDWMRSTGITARQIDDATGSNMGGHYLTTESQPAVATAAMFDRLRPLLPDVPERIEQLVRERTVESENMKAREVIGVDRRMNEPSGIVNVGQGERVEIDRLVTLPHSPEAERWSGWGSALKPAHEPIVIARKPLAGTLAQTVSRFGTGAMNIDGCRIASPDTEGVVWTRGGGSLNARGGPRGAQDGDGQQNAREQVEPHAAGRWPANVVLVHSESCRRVGTRRVKGAVSVGRNRDGEAIADEVYGARRKDMTYADADGMEQVEAWECAENCPVAELDRQSAAGGMHSAGSATDGSPNGNRPFEASSYAHHGRSGRVGDSGGASRFFYTAKASSAERNALDASLLPRVRSARKRAQQDAADRWRPRVRNWHPTVKPVDVLRWAQRLVTPPGGVVLDPFEGSGSGAAASILEGFQHVGVDNDPGYVGLARARAAWTERHGEAAVRAWQASAPRRPLAAEPVVRVSAGGRWIIERLPDGAFRLRRGTGRAPAARVKRAAPAQIGLFG